MIRFLTPHLEQAATVSLMKSPSTFQAHDPVVAGVRVPGGRVRDEPARGRGQGVGPAEGQADNELREAEPSAEVLQRRQHSRQGPEQEVHLQVRLRPARHRRLQRQGAGPEGPTEPRKVRVLIRILELNRGTLKTHKKRNFSFTTSDIGAMGVMKRRPNGTKGFHCNCNSHFGYFHPNPNSDLWLP